MKSRLCCNRSGQARANNGKRAPVLLCSVLCLGMLAFAPAAAFGGDAPQWMHALVNRPLPLQDEKAEAVVLFSETNVNVVSTATVKTVVRRAYKILRPKGREFGTVVVVFQSYNKVTGLHGWCIPAQGKDYEVKDKEAVEVSLPHIEGSELITDVKAKVLRIPAADPGNIVGYEYQTEERPLVLQDTWVFQDVVPVQESHYSLQLPAGWEYKASWMNSPEVRPAQTGTNQWHWSVSNQKALRKEEDMPPMRGLLGQMVLSFLGPGTANVSGYTNWRQMGTWYRNLTSGRVEASAEIKQKVVALTAAAPTQLDKMKALAQFVQRKVRYVAIELGIGGWQPHPAAEVFTHSYGDCKDKTTLLAAMLREIAVESYYVVINSERGSITQDTPAHGGFNHVILAIKVPDGITDASLVATMQHPALGKLLFFDATNELTPFGQIGGHLQSNYGLLVGPDGGELVELPKQPSSMNGIRRTAKLMLDASGKLQGEVVEERVGDRARSQRRAQRTLTTERAWIKPIENLLAGSLSNFRITKASVVNLDLLDQPFGFSYTFEAEKYAKTAGNFLLMRPRVLGVKSSAILEKKEPRQFPIEFDGPVRDTDNFEIAVPPGYEVDELPPPADADFSFASYHSRAEVKGNVIRYSRTFEVKELSVPVSKAEELKRFYRIIAGDERNTAVLKPAK
jgi:hypothetical protein